MNVTQIHMERLAQGRRRKWSLVSLVFTLFYFVPYFMVPEYANPADIALGIAVYCCFVSAYIAGVYANADKVHWALIGILFVAAISMSINPVGLIFFGYPAFIAGYHYRTFQSLSWAASIITVQLMATYLADVWVTLYIVVPIISILGLMVFGMMERRESLHRLAEQQANSQIEQVSAIAERERISRDLHDLVGHSLSSIALKAELAEKLMAREQYEKAQSEVGELAQLTRTVLSDVRKAVSDIKQKNFNSEIQRLKKDLIQQGFQVDANIALPALSALEESNLILIAKETVTNVLRHSQGKHVKIGVHSEQNTLYYRISDDGVADKPVFGNGLNGIIERLKPFGGSLDIEQQKGLTLLVSLPLGVQHD